jgi:ribosome-associated protein
MTANGQPAAASTSPLPIGPEELVDLIAGYAADKKAIDPVALDVRGILGYTDFFFVCTGNTERQVKAIHDGINEGLKKEHGLLPRRVEGLTEARWVLMDYLDVIVHIMTPESRDFYRLEQLWGEAQRRPLPEDVVAAAESGVAPAGEGSVAPAGEAGVAPAGEAGE